MKIIEGKVCRKKCLFKGIKPLRVFMVQNAIPVHYLMENIEDSGVALVMGANSQCDVTCHSDF